MVQSVYQSQQLLGVSNKSMGPEDIVAHSERPLPYRSTVSPNLCRTDPQLSSSSRNCGFQVCFLGSTTAAAGSLSDSTSRYPPEAADHPPRPEFRLPSFKACNNHRPLEPRFPPQAFAAGPHFRCNFPSVVFVGGSSRQYAPLCGQYCCRARALRNSCL